MPDRWRSQEGSLFRCDARNEEGLDPSLFAHDRECAVAGSNEVTSAINDELQDRLEIELTKDAKPRAVQREQLAILPGQPVLQSLDDGEDGLGEEQRPDEDDPCQ